MFVFMFSSCFGASNKMIYPYRQRWKLPERSSNAMHWAQKLLNAASAFAFHLACLFLHFTHSGATFYSLHSDARRPTSETSIAVILIVHTCREQFIECSAGGQVARKELLITLRDPSSSTSFSVQCQQFPICWKGLQHLLGVSPTLLQAVVGSPNARYSLCFPFQDGKKKHLNSRVLQH